jgi:hypothetical protein
VISCVDISTPRDADFPLCTGPAPRSRSACVPRRRCAPPSASRERKCVRNRTHARTIERTSALSCTVAAHVSSPHHPTIQDPLSITAVLCYRYEIEWMRWGDEGRYAPVPTLATSRLHGGLALLLDQGRIMLHVCAC